MKYREMSVEVLGSPGQHYWQVNGVIGDMPHSERCDGTFINAGKCAIACRKAIDVMLDPTPEKKKRTRR